MTSALTIPHYEDGGGNFVGNKLSGNPRSMAEGSQSKLCYLFRQEKPVFALLGRHGDIIQLCPAFKAVYDRTGVRPLVFTSTDYYATFDAITYVDVEPVRANWYAGISKVRERCKAWSGRSFFPFWASERSDEIIREQSEDGVTIIQSHGLNWGVPMNESPNYGTSMWHRAGFTATEMVQLPLELDGRDPEREARLCLKFANAKKPLLLYNFSGVSSPFRFVPEVMRVVHEFSQKFTIVDIGQIRAYRVYDLVGIMDRAAGMITSDTCTLHLAAASMTPYIAYLVGGWTQSVPRGNVSAAIPYDETLSRLETVRQFLESL